MIKRILIGYDGSEQADDALLVGAGLAAHIDADVLLGASFSDEQREAPGETVSEALARRSKALFSDAKARLPASALDRVESRAVVRDSAADGLGDLASDEDVELIVIGSTHRGGFGRVLPGSLALQLIGSTPCPLAIAPRRVPVGNDPGSGPVIAAFDGSELSTRAVAFAAQLAAQADTFLHIIGVAASDAQINAPFVGAGVPVGSRLDRDALQKALDEQMENLPADLAAEGTVLKGSPVESLVASAHGSRGIFVSGSHGRGPLMSLVVGSVSNAIAQRISWPAVLVPPQARIATGANGESESRDPVQ